MPILGIGHSPENLSRPLPASPAHHFDSLEWPNFPYSLTQLLHQYDTVSSAKLTHLACSPFSQSSAQKRNRTTVPSSSYLLPSVLTCFCSLSKCSLTDDFPTVVTCVFRGERISSLVVSIFQLASRPAWTSEFSAVRNFGAFGQPPPASSHARNGQSRCSVDL